MSVFYFLLTNQNIYVTSSFQEKRIMSDHMTSYHQPVKTDVFQAMISFAFTYSFTISQDFCARKGNKTSLLYC